MRSRRAVAAGVLAMLSLTGAPAEAFVCTQVQRGQEGGPSLSWFTREIPFCMHAAGTAQIPGDAELDVVRASFTRWGVLIGADGIPQGTPPQEAVPPFRTTDLEFHECETLSESTAVGYDYLNPDDNENLILFVDEGWFHEPPGDRAVGVETLALTTSTFNALTGEILDSDIEFNTARVHFSAQALPPAPTHDLLNTAVHEVGHLVGLGHSPNVNASMYESAPQGETSKRSLSPDDRNGVVFKYPAGEPNGYCDPVATTGCTCAPPGSLTTRVAITAGDHSLGEGGCAAGGAPAGWVLLPLVWALNRLSGRRRRNPRPAP